MKVVLASNNAKKLEEMRDCLPDSLQLITASDFDIESPEETGTTFVENAIIKARYSAKISGLPAIADDSGLEVDYLNGQPGIYSSRYAGENANDADNNQKLLTEMRKADTRTARFRCVIVYLRHELDPMPIISSGTWEGSILEEALGSGGFGYDPIFYVDALKTSVASLSAEQKRQFSHRGQALRQFQELFDGR